MTCIKILDQQYFIKHHKHNLIALPDFVDNKEVEEKVWVTLLTEPRLVPLLEKVGIELRQGQNCHHLQAYVNNGGANQKG